MFTKRDIQDILNRVMDAGHYKPEITGQDHSWYMCIAARKAAQKGVIRYIECDFLCNEIENYILQNSTVNVKTLAGMLTCMHLPNTFNDRMMIYRNWDNRPGLHRKPNKIVEYFKDMFK